MVRLCLKMRRIQSFIELSGLISKQCGRAVYDLWFGFVAFGVHEGRLGRGIRVMIPL